MLIRTAIQQNCFDAGELHYLLGVLQIVNRVMFILKTLWIEYAVSVLRI